MSPAHDAFDVADLLAGVLGTGFERMLEQPAAVAALVSAVASWVKACAVGIRSSSSSSPAAAIKPAAGQQAADAAAAGPARETADAAAAPEPTDTSVQHVVWVLNAVNLVLEAQTTAACEVLGTTSSSQVLASARLLLVLVARSLLVLHDALADAAAAAGVTPAELISESFAAFAREDAEQQEQQQQHQGEDVARSGKCSAGHSSNSSGSCAVADPEHFDAWHEHQSNTLAVAATLTETLATAVMQPPQQQLPQQQQQQQQQQSVIWPHLLQLHTIPELVTAVQQLQSTVFRSHLQLMQRWSRNSSSSSSSSSSDQSSWRQWQQQQQLRLDDFVSGLLRCCRVLVSAVPLPEVCNNPGCSNLRGVSEAAAAVKACAGRGTRYCCRECQQAHWRQHKKACRRLRGAQA
jgi:hypothetical protein